MTRPARDGRRLGLVLVALVLVTSACGTLFKRRHGEGIPPIKLIAVLPIEPAEAPPQAATVGVAAQPPPLAPDVGRVVTAQVYGVISASPRWHFVPDLVVEQALRDQPVTGSVEERAVRLGKAVQADAVLCGSVSRFVEREGSEFGARNPASVSFRLALVAVATGRTVWHGAFDQTQQALALNLFNWWQFWRAGPRWFRAAELARLGVEELLGNLEGQLPEP